MTLAEVIAIAYMLFSTFTMFYLAVDRDYYIDEYEKLKRQLRRLRK